MSPKSELKEAAMKRVLMLLALVGGVTIPAAVAGAAPLTATDFAADCAADGRIEVTGTQRYVGGEATLTGDCQVVLAADSTLVLKNLTLTGTTLVTVATAPNTTVRVVDSSLAFDDFLELTAGCCAGDSEVPENDGTVVIRGSDLVAGSIYINTSFDWPNGRIVIRDSQLESMSTNPFFGVTIRSSDLGGTDGSIRVVRSAVTSQTFVQVATGTSGRTVVSDNTLTVLGATDVSTGLGGTCIAKHNTPAVSCS